MISEDIRKGNFAILISTIALCVSLISAFMYYWHNIHAHPDTKAVTFFSSIYNNISMNIAFINCGNQYTIIKSANIMVAGMTKKGSLSYNNLFHYLDNKLNLFLTKSDSTFPLILKPGEMYLAKLKAPFDLSKFIAEAINNNNDYYPNTVLIGLETMAINSKGKLFIVHSICGVIHNGNTPIPNIEFPGLIDLFSESKDIRLQQEQQSQNFPLP
jgi:hypothetical protein